MDKVDLSSLISANNQQDSQMWVLFFVWVVVESVLGWVEKHRLSYCPIDFEGFYFSKI